MKPVIFRRVFKDGTAVFEEIRITNGIIIAIVLPLPISVTLSDMDSAKG
jgi:hypothetical protein